MVCLEITVWIHLADHQVSSVISALVLAAPDPVAVCGIQLLSGWGLATSIVTGQSTDNEVGVDAIHRHTGVAAIMRARNLPFVEEVLGRSSRNRPLHRMQA